MSTDDWTVRPPTPDDHDAWWRLFAAYVAFYGRAESAAGAERVWRWIHDEDHEVECLLVESAAQGVVGLAHFREFARPLVASVGGFLDDLFVAPAARGSGAADALVVALRGLGAERGWTVVRWITAEDNLRARAFYVRVAERTAWVTYDIRLEGAEGA